MLSKVNFHVKWDRICIDKTKLGNNELVGSYSLIEIIDSCFTANYLNVCDGKVMLMEDVEEEKQVEEDESPWEVQEVEEEKRSKQ